jgi:hypothetical protein
MPSVVLVGARLFLDPTWTDLEFLGVRVGLFAELDDGRRVIVDPLACQVSGPRRGAGALWGSLTVDVRTLPSLDQELFAVDPLAAATAALEADFVLRAEHLEQFVRDDWADLPWLALTAERVAAQVVVNGDDLQRLPMRVELDDALQAEIPPL